MHPWREPEGQQQLLQDDPEGAYQLVRRHPCSTSGATARRTWTLRRTVSASAAAG